MSREQFRAKWTGIRFDRLSMQRCDESVPRVVNNTTNPKRYGIVFATRRDQPTAYVKGLELSPADIVIFSVGSEGHNRSEAPCQWGSLGLGHEDLAAAAEVLTGRELIAPPLTRRLRPPAPLLLRLTNLHEAAGLLAETAPDVLAHPAVAQAMERALHTAFARFMGGSRPPSWHGALPVLSEHGQVPPRLRRRSSSHRGGATRRRVPVRRDENTPDNRATPPSSRGLLEDRAAKSTNAPRSGAQRRRGERR
jgi:hypothetical protein